MLLETITVVYSLYIKIIHSVCAIYYLPFTYVRVVPAIVIALQLDYSSCACYNNLSSNLCLPFSLEVCQVDGSVRVSRS